MLHRSTESDKSIATIARPKIWSITTIDTVNVSLVTTDLSKTFDSLLKNSHKDCNNENKQKENENEKHKEKKKNPPYFQGLVEPDILLLAQKPQWLIVTANLSR